MIRRSNYGIGYTMVMGAAGILSGLVSVLSLGVIAADLQTAAALGMNQRRMRKLAELDRRRECEAAIRRAARMGQ